MSHFRGISADQDPRFSNKNAKLLKSIQFPACFDEKVEMKKVNFTVIKTWITNEITELLGFEDDVVIEMIFSFLEEQIPDPKNIQINLTGFLETKSSEFMEKLWNMLLSAQASPVGIPKELVEKKKEELAQQRKEQERVAEAIRKQQNQEKKSSNRYFSEQPLQDQNRHDRIRERYHIEKCKRDNEERYRSERRRGRSRSRERRGGDDYYGRKYSRKHKSRSVDSQDDRYRRRGENSDDHHRGRSRSTSRDSMGRIKRRSSVERRDENRYREEYRSMRRRHEEEGRYHHRPRMESREKKRRSSSASSIEHRSQSPTKSTAYRS